LSTTGGRPLRADAARNRARVLEKADEVFGEQGRAGSTEEVARRAGVGIATVFRHFPTKEALLAEVLAARLRTMAGLADRLATDDPSTAFFLFFREVIGQSHSKNLLTEALTDAGVDVDAARRGADVDLRASVGRLLAAGQEAGTVRADVGVAEVFPLLAAAARVAEVSPDDATRDRAVGVVLDGLRARS
jgi:AcrR family transcriptional regulator